MLRPLVRDGVQDHEPDRQPEVPSQAPADLEVRTRRPLAVLLDDLGGRVEAVQHPDQNGAQDGAVEEVDGEGVLAEPEEVLV